MHYEELIQKINAIRKNRSYLSNAFFTKPQLDILLAKAGTQTFESEGLILLTEEKNDLVRIYFYAANNVVLRKMKNLIHGFDKPVIADIVGKNPQTEVLAQLLTDNGFEQYSVFVRLTCSDPKKLEEVDTSTVEFAKADDINAIFGLLYSEFDPLFSHIPPEEDIVAAISKKEIMVVRKQQQLAGFAFFEVTSPKNICLRYFIVNENYRRQGIGNALLARAFEHHGEDVKYMLWVGTYNSAIKKYERLNFKQDGMIDYILKFRGE